MSSEPAIAVRGVSKRYRIGHLAKATTLAERVTQALRNPFAKDLAEVNFWRLEQAIAAGKLDAKKPIDGSVLVAAGVVRRVKDGVRLLAKGELTTKLDITVFSASGPAKAAVEKAGGKITITQPPKAAPAEA